VLQRLEDESGTVGGEGAAAQPQQAAERPLLPSSTTEQQQQPPIAAARPPAPAPAAAATPATGTTGEQLQTLTRDEKKAWARKLVQEIVHKALFPPESVTGIPAKGKDGTWDVYCCKSSQARDGAAHGCRAAHAEPFAGRGGGGRRSGSGTPRPALPLCP
jgi:hypothetical protein